MRTSNEKSNSKSLPSMDSAITHVTGESEYVDDRPELPGELHVGCVFSIMAHAEFKLTGMATAEKIPGFACMITAKDVAHNAWGPIFADQPMIADKITTYSGEVLAVVGASSSEALRKILKTIEVQYKSLPAVMTVREAVVAKSFFGSERFIRRGDCATHLAQAHHKISGTIVLKGADHFYLENQSAVAYPKENRQMEVHSSTQHPTETQHVVAEALGVNFADVVCIVKRLGGGFGGKESQSSPIAAYAALVAQKTQKSARIVLTKDDDMIMTGKRNPFEIDYEVGFDSEGKIIALSSRLYSDGGAYADLSTAIMERAMLHSDNAYYIPHVDIVGQVCKTNHHPHTAFRGFGGPKGAAAIEGILEDIAEFLKIDALDVRKANVYRDGFDVTPYLQKVDNNLLPKLFEDLEKSCDYRKRRQHIDALNKESLSSHGELIHGLSMTAVKFGISFTTRFLNQGNALVQIHRDGSVQISTGAVEMGQGVNTRIAMLAAEELGVSLDCIRVMQTSTEKNANTSPTAASTGTDINGAAAVKACKLLKERLATVAFHLSNIPPEHWPSKTAGLGTTKEIDIHQHVSFKANFANGKITIEGTTPWTVDFATVVNEAYLSRVSLGEYAFHRTENLGFNKLTGQGQAFHYFTQGVAASEVTINRYTGETKVQRVDILMDLGRPIHKDLDIGQVTGAFVQGMGWMTTENLVYNNQGLLLSHSPSTYKIPSIQDTPRTFNVELAHNNENIVNVRGTKAVGEPPLLLAISVWTAIKDALKYVTSKKSNDSLQLPIPATAEQVLRRAQPELFQRLEAGNSFHRNS